MTGKLTEFFADICFRTGSEETQKLENMFSSPDQVLIPHLIEAYELETMMPFVRDVPEFSERGLENATRWSDGRGLLTALVTAVGWLGFAETPENSEQKGAEFVSNSPGIRWSTYGIVLGGPVPAPEEIRKIKGVTALSEPGRSLLTRIAHSRHNVRRMSLSSPNAIPGRNPLSNDSGVYDQDNILISMER